MNPDSSNRAGTHTLRERLKEATSSAILQAAEDVFGQQGLHAAKMEDVASKAGVAVGTLYNHFKDRSDLLASLSDTRRQELLERVDRVLAERKREPFEAQLRAFLEALNDHLAAHGAFLSILMQHADLVKEAREKEKGCSSRVSRPRWALDELYRRLEKLVERGLASGALRPEDAELYPTMLMGMIRGAMVRRLYYDKPGDHRVAQRVDMMVRFFMRGAGR